MQMNDFTAKGILDHTVTSSLRMARRYLELGNTSAVKRSIAQAEESLRKVQRYVKMRDQKGNV